MAKKKPIKQQPSFTEEDLAYIEFKMNPTNKALMSAEPIPYVDYSYNVDIKCKNQKQKQYLNLLKDDSKQIVAALGEPGTGKSWVSLAYALQSLKVGRFKKIICFCPTTPAGAKALDIGFLPGDLEQKMSPYIQADCETMKSILEDSGNAMAERVISGLRRNKVIEHRLVNYARGCSINNALILINEAQNFSIEELILLLTRVGGHKSGLSYKEATANGEEFYYGNGPSKIVLSGDIRQLDRHDIQKGGKKQSILEVVERLEDLEEFGRVDFEKGDIVRNPLIGKILERLDPLNEKIQFI
jgi:phosphate starvation-inducible PhoH-like protein